MTIFQFYSDTFRRVNNFTPSTVTIGIITFGWYRKLTKMEKQEKSNDSTERISKSWLRPSFCPRRSSVSTYAKCHSDYSSSLIASEQWNLLRKYLTTVQGSTELTQLLTESLRPNGLRRNSLHDMRENTGATLLHTCCQLHPPLDIVTRMVQLCPPVVNQRDAWGRYPLHVAAAFGASPRIVKFLILQNNSAAARRDFEGKTPLHLCCEYGCFEGSCDPGVNPPLHLCCEYGCFEGSCDLGVENGENKATCALVKGPVLQVLFDIFTAAPRSINVKDSEGMTPLENAIILGADIKVINFLQKLSEYMVRQETKKSRGEEVSMTEHISYAKHVLRIMMRSAEKEVYVKQEKLDLASSFAGSNSSGLNVEKHQIAPRRGLIHSQCRRLSLQHNGATQHKYRRLSLPNLTDESRTRFRSLSMLSDLTSKNVLEL